MNKLSLLLESYGGKKEVLGRTVILYTHQNWIIYVRKDYKGYNLEITEFAGNNFAKVSKFQSTKMKDIIEYVENKLNK